LLDALRAGHFARVFNILHGQHGGGEDGVLQGALESLNVPYTGSGVLGSALSMDKVRSKRVWQSLGLPTPAFVALPRGADAATVHAAAQRVGFPLIVKPACEGSSVGVTRVFEEAQLDSAVELAAKYPGDLLMETLVEGDELTVAILGRQVLPSIHIVPKGAFYDYNAKYVAEDTQYLCPGSEGAAEQRLGALALQRLGPGGRDARPRRPSLAAGSEHRAGHDLALAGAEGGRRGGHRLPGTVLARVADEFRGAGNGERGTGNVAFRRFG
jgi:D-alanine-D-alanine ligase